jgi:hypothetical protein
MNLIAESITALANLESWQIAMASDRGRQGWSRGDNDDTRGGT